MSDPELVRDILLQILEATRRIARRFAPVSSVADFLRSEEGLEKLDAICMLLMLLVKVSNVWIS